jgi:2-polyprenyl-3-methyl-5-hydroxy-6-metoxy-1,4-benzoquinol methylase
VMVGRTTAISRADSNAEASGLRMIEYLSPAGEVSMSDGYFQIATTDHFWVRRRFDVLRRMADGIVSEAGEIAEVGCGHGLLQRQIEDKYGKPVTGFDLNEYGLKHNVSLISRVCCYDIHQRNGEFRNKFDLILLFDVLEHIPDEDGFLSALLFHLAPGGKLILNVPGGRWAFSEYDTMAGHVRRYGMRDLRAVAQRNALEINNWTWWGFPLLPTLALRKLVLRGMRDQSKINATGFDPKAPWVDKALSTLARLEWIPQKLAGTSLMAVLQPVPGRSIDPAL